MGIRKNDLIRNVAIIAHVDHGKTTIVDSLLKQAGAFRRNEVVADRVLDSSDLERERGITILSKNTSVFYEDLKINIVDTPGHADFGGEVERVLRMVDGALLLVDAYEGPMAQTKFVLRKALEAKLKIIVVVNKMDRPDARPLEVIDEVLDLFIELEADDHQLEFPVLYASAREGRASLSTDQQGENMRPLFEMIKQKVPAPNGAEKAPLQLQITTLDYDDYVGRIAIGRINNGIIKAGQTIGLSKRDGSLESIKISKLWTYEGLKKVDALEVGPGDIVAISGLGKVEIGETVTDLDDPQPLPLLRIDEPTMSMNFLVNDSPFAGQEGKFVTSRHIRERLYKEAETNVSLKVSDTNSPDTFIVSGRGELHLGILIETMRREGYEMAVSKPKPIFKEIEGNLHEPFERLFINVPEIYSGRVIENLGLRKGEMLNMQPAGSTNVHLDFLVPARGLIGFRSEFLTLTKGEGIMHHSFESYGLFKGEITHRNSGSLIAFESGDATAYALDAVKDRGELFITPGTKVYAGMIVGEHNKDSDIEINVCKKKHLTNMRAAGSDDSIKLSPPRVFSLEQSMEYIEDDELVEITPSSIRMRKKILDRNQRTKAIKKQTE
ncbi:MAG: translational GTPase TypA [Firmicutes bacterium]|nr:translational GTPase TypA [Bacillota bacterium]MDD4694027.1 translational GTPase TypA [Bacillota bacterium]